MLSGASSLAPLVGFGTIWSAGYSDVEAFAWEGHVIGTCVSCERMVVDARMPSHDLDGDGGSWEGECTATAARVVLNAFPRSPRQCTERLGTIPVCAPGSSRLTV
jgi:hypothetical protein